MQALSVAIAITSRWMSCGRTPALMDSFIAASLALGLIYEDSARTRTGALDGGKASRMLYPLGQGGTAISGCVN